MYLSSFYLWIHKTWNPIPECFSSTHPTKYAQNISNIAEKKVIKENVSNLSLSAQYFFDFEQRDNPTIQLLLGTWIFQNLFEISLYFYLFYINLWRNYLCDTRRLQQIKTPFQKQARIIIEPMNIESFQTWCRLSSR